MSPRPSLKSAHRCRPKRCAVVRIAIDRAGKLIFAVANNYATHKHPKERAWLGPCTAASMALRKRLHLRLKPGVFRSIVEVQVALNSFLAETNADARLYHWTKDPNTIIAAVKQGHQVLDSIHRP